MSMISLHTYDEAVGAQLRAQRLQSLVKQSELAAALHVTRSTVTRWEQGMRGMQVTTLLQAAEALGIPGYSLLPPAHQGPHDPRLAAVLHVLSQRPDLIEAVQMLLETLLLADDATEAGGDEESNP